MTKQIETPKTAKASKKAAAVKAPVHIVTYSETTGEAKIVKANPQTGKKGDGRTKLTGAQIDFIRRNALQLGGELSQPKLAAKFGVCQPTISYVVRGLIRNS